MISKSNAPNYLLKLVIEKLPKKSSFLDLGCGYGSDAIFMARNGFKVVAVEKSKPAVENIQQILKRDNLKGVNILNDDILNFKIEKNKYNIIQSFNALQFLPEKKALKIVKDIKNKIFPGGFIILSSFTIEDPSFKKKSEKILTYFKPQQMLKLFKGFNIMYYFEGVISDRPHKKMPYHHQHGIVKIIAQKVMN